MALVTCPECGKANVSDIAEHCPECGYPIKKHYDEIKQEELEQIRHENRVQSVPMPEKPSLWKEDMMIIGYFFSFGAILFFSASILLGNTVLFSSIYLLIFGGAGILSFYSGYSNYKKDMQAYNSALEDFNKYQEQVAREEERIEYINSKKPKCPHCGSINIEKISAMSRSISVSALGLASDKIGKQYHCKDCNHNW